MKKQSDWTYVTIVKIQFITTSNLKLTRMFVLNESFSKNEIEKKMKNRFKSIETILKVEELREGILSIN